MPTYAHVYKARKKICMAAIVCISVTNHSIYNLLLPISFSLLSEKKTKKQQKNTELVMILYLVR